MATRSVHVLTVMLLISSCSCLNKIYFILLALAFSLFSTVQPRSKYVCTKFELLPAIDQTSTH